MTRFRDVVPSTYICSDDLHGRDVTVTIAGFEIEEMYVNNGKRRRPVLYFEGGRKGLVVNATINATLTKLYGPEMESWKGHRVTLFPTTDDRGGQERNVVRIRPTVPAAKPAKPADVPTSEEPAKPAQEASA